MTQNPDNPIAEDMGESFAQSNTGVLARMRGYFLTGIVVTAPSVITVYVTWWFLKFIDTNVAGLLPAAYNPNSYLPVNVPGVGLILAIGFFIGVGWFARNFFGRMLIRWSEYIVAKMPVVSTIYNAVKQVFETTMGAQSKAFREVVFFEYPRKECWTVGFVTGVTQGELQNITDDEIVNVYVPTTPNPTSGFLLFLPRKDLIYLDMSPEDAIKLIVSGGIITPPEKPAKIKAE